MVTQLEILAATETTGPTFGTSGSALKRLQGGRYLLVVEGLSGSRKVQLEVQSSPTGDWVDYQTSRGNGGYEVGMSAYFSYRVTTTQAGPRVSIANGLNAPGGPAI